MSHVAQGKQQKKLFVWIQEATNLMSLVCALYSRQVVEVIAAHRGIADIGGFARTLYENTCRLATLVLCQYSDVSSTKIIWKPQWLRKLNWLCGRWRHTVHLMWLFFFVLQDFLSKRYRYVSRGCHLRSLCKGGIVRCWFFLHAIKDNKKGNKYTNSVIVLGPSMCQLLDDKWDELGLPLWNWPLSTANPRPKQWRQYAKAICGLPK